MEIEIMEIEIIYMDQGKKIINNHHHMEEVKTEKNKIDLSLIREIMKDLVLVMIK